MFLGERVVSGVAVLYFLSRTLFIVYSVGECTYNTPYAAGSCGLTEHTNYHQPCTVYIHVHVYIPVGSSWYIRIGNVHAHVCACTNRHFISFLK